MAKAEAERHADEWARTLKESDRESQAATRL
jgi:hypothetical protein